MNDKIVGYILLVVGILIMTFAVVEVFLVFTSRKETPHIFRESASVPDFGSLINANMLSSALPLPNTSLPNELQTPKVNIISQDSINQALNFTTYFFLMSFLLGFGFRVASLGVMLIRPVYVKMREKEVLPNQFVIPSFEDKVRQKTG